MFHGHENHTSVVRPTVRPDLPFEFKNVVTVVIMSPQVRQDLIRYVHQDTRLFEMHTFASHNDQSGPLGYDAMTEKCTALLHIPHAWITPIEIGEVKYAHGKWKAELPTGAPMIGMVTGMVDDLCMLGIGSLWDWVRVYQEDNATLSELWLNVNPISAKYQRLLARETEDDGTKWTLLRKQCNYAMARYRALYFDPQWESPTASFVEHMVHTWGQRSQLNQELFDEGEE
jgi:hypothetical protein